MPTSALQDWNGYAPPVIPRRGGAVHPASGVGPKSGTEIVNRGSP